MANAPNPRGGSRQWTALRAGRTTTLVGNLSRAVFAFALLSASSMSVTRAEEAGQWRPRKPASDASSWSPDAAGRLLGDTPAPAAAPWLPSRPQTPLAKPPVEPVNNAAYQAPRSGPQLPRYAALRAEIADICADYDAAVVSQADQRQFDLILVRAYRVRDDAQTPSERALADLLLKRVSQQSMPAPRAPHAERTAPTRTWLSNLSSDAGDVATLILTGHDGVRRRAQSNAEKLASSPQARVESPIASNPVREAWTQLMSSGLPVPYRDSDVQPASATRSVEYSRDRASSPSLDYREPARFIPASTFQRVAATESSSRPLPTPPVQAAPTIIEQIPLLKQLGDWWQSRTPRDVSYGP